MTDPALHRTVETHAPAETRRLAARLGRLARPGDVIALVGDLGAGKTCFVQGLARGLGVPASDRVASPTFNIILEHAGRMPLYHVDLYRIADESELAEIGLEGYLYGEGLCAVEWMDRFPGLAPRERLEVTIAMIDDPRDRMGRGRRITATGHGARGRALVAAWLDERAL